MGADGKVLNCYNLTQISLMYINCYRYELRPLNVLRIANISNAVSCTAPTDILYHAG